MPTLSHAINTALAELKSSLAGQHAQGKSPLVPERAQLTLAFSLNADGTTDASSGGPHSVTVHFTASDLSNRPAVSAPPLARAAANPASGASGEVVTALTQVFGPPGFDSSARASVFSEALVGLSDEQVLAVLAAVTAPVASTTDASTRMAAHLLRGVIQSGPTKVVAPGVDTLRELFSHHALAEVLRVAKAEWKTQTEWL